MIDFFRDKSDEKITKENKIIGLGLVAGVFVMSLGLIVGNIDIQVGGVIFISGIVVTILPFALVSFMKNRAIKNSESNFPNFLNDLAESKRGGMTTLGAFESARESDYGRLDKEIEKIYNQLSWGIPFPKTMNKFSIRMDDSKVITQSIMIINQSYKSGGKMTETIQSVADNATMLRNVIDDKNSTMRQQLVIMYIIYILFIGISVGIYFLLEQLLGLGTEGTGLIGNLSGIIGDSGGPVNYCSGEIFAAQPFCQISQIFGFVPSGIEDLGSPDAEEMGYGQMAYYKSLLFSMLMVQAVATSAVAGKMSDGKASAGLKHAIVLIPIAFFSFMLLVRPMGY